jgi:CheY-like chemotaxis protein
MDHMMPGMDGVEATRIIREKGAKATIIALTANAVAGAKEEFFAAGMDDWLTKPINKALFFKILEKWVPAEKVTKVFAETVDSDDRDDTCKTGDGEADSTQEEFRSGIEQIEGLSVKTGLERNSGWDSYKTSLRLMIKEIETCAMNLNEFLDAGDMHNFTISVHGMKSALAFIGASELSRLAYDLELASDKGDAAFCASNLQPFLKRLTALGRRLSEAFAKDNLNRGPIVIPPELPPIFQQLAAAFDETDFLAIDEGIENLDALNPGAALKDEIERLKDAVLMMDYEEAKDIMRKLLE